MRGRARTWPLWLLALVLASLAVFWASRGRAPRTPASTPQAAPTAQRPAPPTTAAPPDAAAAPAPAPVVEPDCRPRAERRCLDGDAWWLDSCGALEERAEECELVPCRDGHCQMADALGCNEPITGRCVGDTVRTCFGGRLRTIDCARRDLHCVMGVEGAECRAEPDGRLEAPSCLGDGAHCEGQTLVRCLGGRLLRTDCSAAQGVCLDDVEGMEATCALGPTPPLAVEPGRGCDACGCPEQADAEERCNGRDDDGDGLLDESVDCGPIPLVAFVVGQPGRFGSYDEADIEREVARVNQHLQASARPGDGPALQVVLEDVVWLGRREWLALSEDTLDTLMQAPLLHPPRDEFAIPVLFTDEVIVGEVPKPGTASLPNGSCGGSQRGRGPQVGLIAVSKARAPTTVVHEIGHFLGLCHTHEHDHARGVRVAAEADGALLVCEAECAGEGDGVCDTPPDPGAQLCPYNSQCQVFCPGPEAPDPTNLMSYYTQCRYRFTREQQARMRHTLALRRGWHDCLGGECRCTPGQASCPAEMGCRPFRVEGSGRVYACALQGPSLPGSPCESSFDCRADASCVGQGDQSQCVRTCGATQTACRCTRVPGVPFALCAEDLP